MNEFSFIFINRFLLHPTPVLDYYSITIQGTTKRYYFRSIFYTGSAFWYFISVMVNWFFIIQSLQLGAKAWNLSNIRLNHNLAAGPNWFLWIVFAILKRNSLPPVAYGSSVLEFILSSGLLYSQHFTTKNIKIITEKTNAT